jgi:hypothetical protein
MWKDNKFDFALFMDRLVSSMDLANLTEDEEKKLCEIFTQESMNAITEIVDLYMPEEVLMKRLQDISSENADLNQGDILFAMISADKSLQEIINFRLESLISEYKTKIS